MFKIVLFCMLGLFVLLAIFVFIGEFAKKKKDVITPRKKDIIPIATSTPVEPLPASEPVEEKKDSPYGGYNTASSYGGVQCFGMGWCDYNGRAMTHEELETSFGKAD